MSNDMNIGQLDDSLEECLKSEVPDKESLHNDLKSESEQTMFNFDKNLIKNVNNAVLVNYLSPEIRENEKTKRKHKSVLIYLLTSFIVLQFITVGILLMNIMSYSVSENAKYEIVKSLLTFVSGYITSVIIELIAILNYIVKNVFDTSITELVKIFKENSDNKNQDK